jgi:hypothetical protein
VFNFSMFMLFSFILTFDIFRMELQGT